MKDVFTNLVTHLYDHFPKLKIKRLCGAHDQNVITV